MHARRPLPFAIAIALALAGAACENQSAADKASAAAAPMEAQALVDCGAYMSQAPGVTSVAGTNPFTLYRVPAFRFEGTIVYTTKPYGGAYRGYGNPQGTFAVESALDEAAAELGLDPVELRRRNLHAAGDVSPLGFRFTSCAQRECLEAVVQALRPDGGNNAAQAIMTTDTVRKEVSIDGGGFTVGGIAKGAAMLAPNMATMLAVLTTDAEASPDVLKRLLQDGVASSFNVMTVDGCQSTNDTVIILASGAVTLSVSDRMKSSRLIALFALMGCQPPLNARAMPLAMAISIRRQCSSSSHLAVPRFSGVDGAPGSQRSARASSWPRPSSVSRSAWPSAFLR